MTKRPTIIERAYELAGEGYLVDPIVQKLNAEGYEGVPALVRRPDPGETEGHSEARGHSHQLAWAVWQTGRGYDGAQRFGHSSFE